MKRIWERFEIKGTVNRKFGSGCHRASKIKDHHRTKMTALKERKKMFVEHNQKTFFF